MVGYNTCKARYGRVPGLGVPSTSPAQPQIGVFEFCFRIKVRLSAYYSKQSVMLLDDAMMEISVIDND